MSEDEGSRCESCGMPIASGRYCAHCIDEEGNLQPFEERFENMVSFTLSRDRSLDRRRAETLVRTRMREMPAWRDHPALNRGVEEGG